MVDLTLIYYVILPSFQGLDVLGAANVSGQHLFYIAAVIFDVDEYAEKLSLLMNNDNIRAHMRENHKMTLFDISPEIVYRQWESLFMKVRVPK